MIARMSTTVHAIRVVRVVTARRSGAPQVEPSGSSESFQIPIEAAEVYEAAFVPGFFAQWAPLLCQAAGVEPGQTVLDVACGTGIVARTAADLVAPGGTVVGVDLNEAMLTVAARVRPDLEWRHGDAAALPFGDRELRHRAVPDGADVLPGPRRGAPRDGPGRAAGGRRRRARAGPARRPAGLRAVRRGCGPTGRPGGACRCSSTYFVCGDLDELTALVDVGRAAR